MIRAGRSAPPAAPAPDSPHGHDLVGPIAPRPLVRRDRALPILIAASLVVHATILLPTLLGKDETAPAPPHEIPVEIIQLPPKPVEPQKSAAKKPPAKAAEKPKAEKKAEAKAAPTKPAPKPAPPKPAPQKPPPPKPVASKPASKPAPKPQVAQKPPPKPSAPKVAAKQTIEKPNDTEQRMKALLGPMPAIPLPGPSAGGTDEVSYTQLVLSKVAKAKKEGRYRGVPGAASVAFTLSDSGNLASVEIVRPSGDQSLDDEAIAMIKRGAPYPPPPPGGRRDYTITLRFQPLI